MQRGARQALVGRRGLLTPFLHITLPQSGWGRARYVVEGARLPQKDVPVGRPSLSRRTAPLPPPPLRPPCASPPSSRPFSLSSRSPPSPRRSTPADESSSGSSTSSGRPNRPLALSSRSAKSGSSRPRVSSRRSRRSPAQTLTCLHPLQRLQALPRRGREGVVHRRRQVPQDDGPARAQHLRRSVPSARCPPAPDLSD